MSSSLQRLFLASLLVMLPLGCGEADDVQGDDTSTVTPTSDAPRPPGQDVLGGSDATSLSDAQALTDSGAPEPDLFVPPDVPPADPVQS